MELTSSGEGLYILDGYGEVHVLGEAPSYSEQVPYQGFDIASDLTLTPSENGYYILTKNGTVVRQGDAAALSIPGATSNVLVDLGLMGLEYTPNAEGFLVMGASGEVTPLLNARLGPDFALNPEENNFTDIEVVGLTAGNAEELIREYFEAYSKEDIDRICALLADDYFDDHYNDCALLTKSLRQVFDYYMIGLPTENPMSIENVEIQVSSGEAIVTADVVISFRYPSFQALAVGDVLTLTIPYNQTVQMVELGDGRNDQLSVYDLDNPEGYFDPAIPQRDRKIFEKTFTKAGVEGPYKLYLKYEGVGQNSAYVFTLADGVNYGILQPADVRIGHYPPETIFHATDTVQFKFTLEREGNRGFLIQKAPLLQMLPVFDAEANPVGFSFARRGPVADYQFLAGDVDANFLFGPGDFRVTGDEGLSITHSLPGYPGVVNLTSALGITEFDQFRVADYKNIPSYRFDDSVAAAIDTVYLVITKDQKRYGLIRPVRLSTSADVDGVLAMVFDWQFRDEFVIPK